MTTPDPSEAREMAGTPGVRLTRAQLDVLHVLKCHLNGATFCTEELKAAVHYLADLQLVSRPITYRGSLSTCITDAGRTALSHTARKDGDRDV